MPAAADGALNRLSAFETATLLGMLSVVDPKHPQRQVRTTPSRMLEIIQVGRSVAHAVHREWINADGEACQRFYSTNRYSPKHMAMIQDALHRMFNRTVHIQRRDPKSNAALSDLSVHILDAFGYGYEQDGHPVDLYDLPPDTQKVNIASEERPIWRLLKHTDTGTRTCRAKYIYFRLNAEMARELRGERGTICSTQFARKIFSLFRRHMNSPAMLRLIILILRQTQASFTRHLRQLLVDLGFADATHPQRATQHLRDALDTLICERVIAANHVDAVADRVEITIDTNWKEMPETTTAT
jgi:hypothetical protein